MKQVLIMFVAVILIGITAQKSYAQLDDQEYNYVTMDLRGILNLSMTTSAQVDFTFKTIQEYNQGITQFNAVQLEVDATLAWDMYVYANSDNWVQVEGYSTNGNANLPAEILEMKSSVNNAVGAAPGFATFASLKGLTNANLAGGRPQDNVSTQYLAGGFGLTTNAGVDGLAVAPGTASNNPTTHKFRIDMRLKPGIPATFPNSTVALLDYPNPGDAPYAMAGYYYLEIVYALIEDL